MRGDYFLDIIPTVVRAIAGDNFTVYAYFNNGAIRLIDVKPLIEEGGVFSAIADPTAFREKLTVLNNTVAWDISGDRDPTKCIDLDPVTIFNKGINAENI